jgi:VWFA-related protein
MSKSIGTASLVAALLFAGSGNAFSQADSPRPNAAPDASITTLQTHVRLVVVDVTVVDKQGIAVKGLKPEDFQLKENNVAQKILSIDDHSAAGSAPVVKIRPMAPDGTTTLSNKPASIPTVWNVLLVDSLNTPIGDQATAQKQIQQFVKGLPPSQPLALVSMSAVVKVLSPFYAGAGSITSALDKGALSPNASPLIDVYNSDDEAIAAAMIRQASMRASVAATTDNVEMGKLEQRVQTTLSSFLVLAKWLNKYPGRKNVYWLSAGFPLQAEPSSLLGESTSHADSRSNLAGELALMQRETDKELESARVAIFPIDVRGVLGGDIPGVTNADSGMYLYVKNPQGLGSQMGKSDRVTASEQAEMLEIAHSTGGIARFNHNDVTEILREDFNQSQNYYTLSYTPSNNKWNGDYRKIDIALEQRGYHLAFRQGYFAKDAKPEPPLSNNQFTLALRHGASPETSVLFSAKLRKAADSLNVEYEIEPQTLQFQPDLSGKEVAEVDCAIVEYDSTGKVMGTSQIHVAGRMSAEQRSALMAAFFPAKQTVPLLPGATWIALGVRDQATGRFGNMEVAVAGH